MPLDQVNLQPAPLPQDEELTEAELRQFDMLAGLHKPQDIEPFVSRVVLRWLEPGSAIYPREGVGDAVIYWPCWEEVLRLKLGQLEGAEATYERMLTQDDRLRDPQATIDVQEWIEHLSGVVSRLERRAWERNDAENRSDVLLPVARLCAVAHQPTSAATPADAPRSQGLLSKFSRLLGGKEKPRESPPARALTSPIVEFCEGELFDPGGLAACVPEGELRLEAIGAGYVMELPRAMLRLLAADGGFREALDAAYRERLLATHLRLVPALCQLKSEALHWLTQRAQLITADPGAVVCDEYEPADALYLVRGGMVEMVRDQSALLHPREVSDWSALCRGLLAGADSHRNT